MMLPNEVIEALKLARDTGQVNMLDRNAVISFIGHHTHEAAYLNGTDPDDWSEIIVTSFPEPRRGRKKKVDEITE